MSDLAEAPSTVVDTGPEPAASGGGEVSVTPDAKPEPSLRDVIADEFKNEGADEKPKAEEKTDAKAEKPETDDREDKPARERDTAGKFAAKPKEDAEPQNGNGEKAEQPKDQQADKSEGKHFTEPPKNFLADSREMWRNVPRPVRRDIEAMVQTHTAEMNRSRETTERYEPIRQYDELARSNGRNLGESLQRIVAVEDALQRDPVYGLNMILQEVGPRDATGRPYSIFEVAQHIVEQGQDHFVQHMQRGNAAQPPQPDPRIQQAQTETMQLRERLTQAEVVAPFKAMHPRFDELSPTIAGLLKSGMIEPSLSADVRLERAYAMAERLVPPSSQDVQYDAEPANANGPDSSAGKSLRSAPGSVSDDMEPERGGSVRELLQDEMRRQAKR